MAEGGIFEDFENPTLDEEAPLLTDSLNDFYDNFLDKNAPSVPGVSGETLRNNEARKDLYRSFNEKGWEQEPGDIDRNALAEHGATIYKDKVTGKIYVRYQEKEILITKERGSGVLAPSGIAKNARNHGLNGDKFVRDVLGLRRYGEGGNTSMSKAAEAAAIDVRQNTPAPTDNIPMKELGKRADQVRESVENLTETVRQDIGVGTDLELQQHVRDLERADHFIKTYSGQAKAASMKIAKYRETIESLESRKRFEELTEEETTKIDDKIADINEKIEGQKEVLKGLEPHFRNQFDRIRATTYKMLYQDKTLGEKLRTLFTEQGVTIASLVTAIGMMIATIVEGTLLAKRSVTAVTPKPPGPEPDPGPSPSPSPGPPKPKTWADWIKDQLRKIANLLLKLGDKMLIALPGIIGAVVNFVLKAAGSVAGFLADHLWAFALGVGILLYTTVMEFVKKK